MIEASELVYTRKDRRLIDNVSLHFPGGEIVAILGPNGAGKSTLLRLLTGYLTPDAGRCSFLGKDLHDWPPADLAALRAVMRQQNHIAFPFSALDVIRMGARGRRQSIIRQQLQEITALCGCQALINRDYCSLSGGEQQRIQLARLLLQLWEERPAPKWLFLDEPTSALDIHHQQRFFRLLRQLVSDRLFSVCCVLHDINLAAKYADRIVLVENGRLVSNGRPEAVLTEDALRALYHADISVLRAPADQTPLVMLHR